MIAEKINLNPIINSLQGWCTEIKAQRLYDLIIESDSKITIELGAYGGRSLIPMALAHKEKGSGFCIGVDAWHKNACLGGNNSPANDEWWSKVNFEQIHNELTRTIDKYELNDYCGTLRLRSQTVGLMTADNIIDVLHQDSAHNIQTIIAELDLWIPKLKMGGYWVADDTDWVEAKEGYAKLPEYGMELIEDYTSWQIWKKVK